MNDKANIALSESVHEVAETVADAFSAAVRLEQATEQAVRAELRRRPRWRTALSVVAWTLVAVYFLFAALFLSLRYWILPNIGNYIRPLENAVSKAIGQKVTIGGINAGWDGLRPELDITEFSIHDRDGRLALSLPAVEAVVSWSSVVLGSVQFHSLAFNSPNLEVRRDAQGRLYVAGMQIKSEDSGPGLSDWLLAQNEVMIRDASLSWTDEQRAAPALELAGVNVLLRNSGSRHRFALRAQTARELASALDVRGDFSGNSLAQLQQWDGRVYAELDYTDLAAWRPWFDYPFQLDSGTGGVRLWLTLAGGKPTEAIADVVLVNVAMRVAGQLPLLELDYLNGRLGARNSERSTEFFGKAMELRNKQGVTVRPTDFSLLVAPGLKLAEISGTGAETGTETGTGAGIVTGTAPQPPTLRTGVLTTSGLELKPLAQLAEYLPFPEQVRNQLADFEPRGTISDFKAEWTGEPGHPSSYSLHGKFAELAMSTRGEVPGFSGLNGSVEATEKSGKVHLSSGKTAIELQRILPDDRLDFDTLAGDVSWNLLGDHYEIRFSRLAMANADMAGTLSGSYAAKYGAPKGVIDLSANFTRADARAAYRYVPWLPVFVRDYLKEAVLAGTSNDVRMRLKGDMERFPFADAKAGTFQVSARINGGEFNYARGWPAISGIAGELTIDGLALRFNAQRGSVLGARLANVRGAIPDLFHHAEQLGIEGQGEGPTQEFLRFIDASPVARLIDGATQDMRAAGNGRLQLKLDIPLRKTEATRVAGSYFVQNNQLILDPDLPPIAQASGRIDFTENSIAARGVSGQFLGGPVSISAQTRADGAIAVSAQGSTAFAALRRYVDTPLASRITGAAPWRSSLVIKKRLLDFSLDSTLQGIAIDLPPPFGKTAAEAMPLRVERGGADSELQRRLAALKIPPRGDAFAAALGKSVNALWLRRPEGEAMVVDRGVIALNTDAPVPDRAGMVLTGSLSYADAERWQPVIDELTKPAAPAPSPAAGSAAVPIIGSTAAGPAAAGAPAQAVAPMQLPALAAINLRFGALDIAGKRLNDVNARLNSGAGTWAGAVASRELSGDVSWHPEGRGRVQARLKQFTLPEDRPAPAGSAAVPRAPDPVVRELPALDIVADEFTLREKRLGRLELVATNEVRDWRIDKLVLATPDATFTASGSWQSWAARPSITLNVKLDVADTGKFMDRMGFPKTMQRGTARLEGRIGWAGSPQSVDYPTLTGNLVLASEKGQFLKADPGVAKLLGVLSLQALVSLDVRDLFRQGFSYDTISATASVTKGVLTTEDFRMKGSSALVSMSGSVDLARETQNLRMRVAPSLGEGATTIAGLLIANPALGLVAGLVNKLLRDPLGQMFALEYQVTGSWDEPKLVRTKVDAPATASTAP